MKTIRYQAFRCTVFAMAVALIPLAHGQAKPENPSTDRDKLIGAWHLISIGESDADKRVPHTTKIRGTLIYTRDGHMSVQLMYPSAQSSLSNDYVLNGYEASFGRYDIDETTHTITHHVEGSVTRGLVGKDLPRIYEFTGGHMVIHSPNPAEHWSVVWEHD